MEPMMEIPRSLPSDLTMSAVLPEATVSRNIDDAINRLNMQSSLTLLGVRVRDRLCPVKI